MYRGSIFVVSVLLLIAACGGQQAETVLDLEILPEEFLTFYINPWCRDFIAVHEDAGMVQRILLIDAEYPSN